MRFLNSGKKPLRNLGGRAAESVSGLKSNAPERPSCPVHAPCGVASGAQSITRGGVTGREGTGSSG